METLKVRYNIELIRLVAVILITFTHTRNGYESGSYFFLFEEMPKIGTVMLSIVSGFLFWETSSQKRSIIRNKVKTLLVPFLLANVVVLALAAIAYYGFDFNFLNRYQFNTSLIANGIFALNEAPINPPTYFIRDIFIVFVIVELVLYRNYWMLLILVPLILIGKLLLRVDILVMFVIGIYISIFMRAIVANKRWIILALLIVSLVLIFYTGVDTYKFPLALLIFILIFNTNIRFYKTGGYTYLLHLYHSPVIVASYPLIRSFLGESSVLSVLTQVFLAISAAFILFLVTRWVKPLKILCGYR